MVMNTLKQQLGINGIEFQPLDNGFLSCADGRRLQAILRRALGSEDRANCCASGYACCPILSQPRMKRMVGVTTSSILQAEFALNSSAGPTADWARLFRGSDS